MSSADNYALRNWGQNTMAWAEDDMEIVRSMAQDVGIQLPQGLNRELCPALKPKRFKLDEYGVRYSPQATETWRHGIFEGRSVRLQPTQDQYGERR